MTDVMKKWNSRDNLLGRWLRCFIRFRWLSVWCAFAIPGGLLAAIVMYGWAYIAGYDPIGQALGGFLGIALSFPLIGIVCQILELHKK